MNVYFLSLSRILENKVSSIYLYWRNIKQQKYLDWFSLIGKVWTMKLSPTQAAARWKKSKATIYNKLNDGEMSCEVVKSGQRTKRLIDVSELVRVFGPEDEQGNMVDPNV